MVVGDPGLGAGWGFVERRSGRGAARRDVPEVLLDQPQPQVELVSADDEESIFLDEEPSAPGIDMTALEQALDNPVTLDLTAIEHRYPLLRNTL